MAVNKRGRLWIVASPSGGGKTSLVEEAIASLDNIVRSISFTTRERRVGEIEGQDYVFVKKEEFEQLILDKKMLEYESVFDNYYGTSLDFVNKQLNNGSDVILTIDWQGSRNVRKIIPESKGIFILPPDIETLERRLMDRAQDNSDVIVRRMQDARCQMKHYSEFDYLIINDDFKRALSEIITIFLADRLLRERQEQSYQDLILSLVKN